MPLFLEPGHSNTKVGETVDTRDDIELVLRAIRSSPEVRKVLAQTVVQEWSRDAFSVKCCVLPGGMMPVRQTKGAVGYDVHVRAVVDAHNMDPDEPLLRKTLFDFEHEPVNPDVRNFARQRGGRWGYTIHPGHAVLVGVGVAFSMPPTLYQWLTPRSGLAAKLRITLGNAPGTVDSDYRGEAAALIVNEGDESYTIYHGDRIGQILFQPVVIPHIEVVDTLGDLDPTERGSGGFGSTGFRADQTRA